MFEPFSRRFDRKNEFLPEEEFPDLLSDSAMVPPDFDVTADSTAPVLPGSSQPERDPYITGTARRELETTADFARFLPTDAIAELAQVSHPVKDDYLDPRLNANLARTNLDLIYREWQEQDPEGDLRKLAYMLATALEESQGTLHSYNEHISPETWQENKIKAYADTGYWGRGFVSLTWETSYKKLGEELGLDLVRHPKLAMLPTVAADIMGTGMFATGFGKARTLDQFFHGSLEDWVGVRSMLGHQGAEATAAKARSLYKSLRMFQQGQVEGKYANADSPVQQLFRDDADGHFAEARIADAERILSVLGYFSKRPDTEPDTQDVQEKYRFELKALRQSGRNQAFTEALQKFQRKFNQGHRLNQPLPEDGKLDQLTYRMLVRGESVTQAGREMIDFAFSGGLGARNSMQQLGDEHVSAEAATRILMDNAPFTEANKPISVLEQLPTNRLMQIVLMLTRYDSGIETPALLNRSILQWLKQKAMEAGRSDLATQLNSYI